MMNDKETIDFKARMKTIIRCLVAMSVLGTVIIFLDSKLDQHMYLLFIPLIVAIGSGIGAFIIYLKINNPSKR